MSDTKKIFLLDTQSTLINKNNELFHPEEVTLLLQGIIKLHSWALLSNGADVMEDIALEAIGQQGVDYHSNPPAYPLSTDGYDTFTGNIIHFFPNFSGKESDSRHSDLLKALELGTFDETESTLNYQDHNTKISLMVDENSWFSVRFSGTNNIITINTKKWLNTREMHLAGDNKLFQSLIAMEQLNLKPVITTELCSLGILAIESPKKCQDIHSENVIVLDDKKEVIDLMASAGFQTIRADTKECLFTEGEEDPKLRDTYVRKLAQQIDPDYLRLIEIKISLKSANPEAKKKLLCEWQIIKDGLASDGSKNNRETGMYKSFPNFYRDGDYNNIYCQFFHGDEMPVWKRGQEIDLKEYKESLPIFN